MEQIVIESPLLEEWLRTALVDDHGEVFLPCGAFDNELKAMLCISHDGVPMFRHEGHIYAPVSWLTREYPRYAKAIDTIAAKVVNQVQPAGSGECDA